MRENTNAGKMPMKTHKMSCHLSTLIAGCHSLGGLGAKDVFIIIAF